MAKRENDRADIIRAAIELVAENGIAAVTTRQIAKKAGVSDGLMYRFFNSKEDLLDRSFFSGIQKGLDPVPEKA